jgi:hypothetical protein
MNFRILTLRARLRSQPANSTNLVSLLEGYQHSLYKHLDGNLVGIRLQVFYQCSVRKKTLCKKKFLPPNKFQINKVRK